jgi:murein DD-endopeptidase MepM/ murein hydrolase activator NlpD
VQSDSLRRNKDIVAPSHIDSLLRERMEHDPQYMLNSSTRTPRSKISASTPMQGLIAERFDARNGLYGVRISGKREAQVMAIADGIVIADDWSPESGSTLIIQHNDSTISVYRHLQSTLPAKGQRVRGSQVIGYAAAQDEKSELSMLEFELWGEGKPLNPEMYIIF